MLKITETTKERLQKIYQLWCDGADLEHGIRHHGQVPSDFYEEDHELFGFGLGVEFEQDQDNDFYYASSSSDSYFVVSQPGEDSWRRDVLEIKCQYIEEKDEFILDPSITKALINNCDYERVIGALYDDFHSDSMTLYIDLRDGELTADATSYVKTNDPFIVDLLAVSRSAYEYDDGFLEDCEEYFEEATKDLFLSWISNREEMDNDLTLKRQAVMDFLQENDLGTYDEFRREFWIMARTQGREMMDKEDMCVVLENALYSRFGL